MICRRALTGVCAETLVVLLLGLLWLNVSQAQDACTNRTTGLMAGQNEDAGDVNVCNDDVNLTITYEAVYPWCLVETHLDVVVNLDQIPQTKKRKGETAGNPKPGQFSYGDAYEDQCKGTATFVIPLSQIGEGVAPNDEIIIAAHAIRGGRRAGGECLGCRRTLCPTRGLGNLLYIRCALTRALRTIDHSTPVVCRW